MSVHIRGNLQSATIYQTVTIESLTDAVLLEIFDHFLVEKLKTEQWFQLEPHQSQWYALVPAHVCQRWRQIIVASPGRLGLSILCSWGLPIADILRLSPPELPLSIYFPSGRSGFDKTPDPMTDILLALGQLDRARHITIDAPGPEMKQLLLMVNRPSPRLATLSITSHEIVSLPPSFTIEGNKYLRKIEFENIRYPLPSAPTVAEFSFSLCDDGSILEPRNNVLQDLVCHLCTMPLLERLTLELLVPQDVLPIKDKSRISLPRLSVLTFEGWHSHLEELISIIDAPVLLNLNICFRQDENTPFALPELASYIRTSSRLNASAAQVGVIDDSFCIRTLSEAGCIQLKVPLEDWVVWHQDGAWRIDDLDQEPTKSILMTIHSTLAPILSSVKTLVLAFDESVYFRGVAGDIDAMNYAAVYALNFGVVLKWFRSVTALRLDNVVAQAVHRLDLWDWVECVPELKDITLFFDTDNEGSTPSTILENFSSMLFSVLDVAVHGRIYPSLGKLTWLERHQDFMDNRR
ncbi:hypothetical protein BC834DRAFT_96605 [Gloeopeniophorella convolvens]|nr:hypothetical protein BC834DRAFT_96605 [Gloeopeniophorella convolvens]